MVLRSVIDFSEGYTPLASILGAMFLLAIPATAALLQGWNDGTRFGTAAVLEGAWTYTASRIMPIAAGLAVIGAIINFAFGRPAIRLIGCAAAFLTVCALAAGCFDDVTGEAMNFLNGITNLTNWMGNVIMPTLAALFFALGVLRFAHGQAHTYTPWAGFLCLMVSGVLRGIETFAAQAAWNNPDLVWITLRGLVNWTCNVILPVYAVLQLLPGPDAVRGDWSPGLCRRRLDAALRGGRFLPGVVGVAAPGRMVHRARARRH
jgi:hypothetical protein